MIKLSKRLAAVAACIPPGKSVCDVGTDHGLIPVYLAQNRLSEKIIAADINSGPLSAAAAAADRYELRDCIELRLCDGLSGLKSNEVECVVIAGMGGENIAEILKKAPWTRENTTLVLQPQSKSDVLRSYLIVGGYKITSENLVEDAGRIYQIITACGGSSRQYTAAELYLGLREHIAGSELLESYFSQLTAKVMKAAVYDEAYRTLLDELIKWKGERKI